VLALVLLTLLMLALPEPLRPLPAALLKLPD
jgi:hypothetical protein